MSRKFLCLAAAFALSHAAQANVLYTWQQVEHSPTVPPGMHLELVFTDAAVASGAVSVDVSNFCQPGETCAPQQDSLVALRYWFDSLDGDRRLNYINYAMGDETHFGRQVISMAIQFLPGGYLSGSLAANDSNSDFSFASQGIIFTMLAAHSDEPTGCGAAYPDCGGERGMLRSDEQALPEPPLAASLAAGALAAWLARRRRSGTVGPALR